MGGSPGQWVIVSDLEIVIASPSFMSLLLIGTFSWFTHHFNCSWSSSLIWVTHSPALCSTNCVISHRWVGPGQYRRTSYNTLPQHPAEDHILKYQTIKYDLHYLIAFWHLTTGPLLTPISSPLWVGNLKTPPQQSVTQNWGWPPPSPVRYIDIDYRLSIFWKISIPIRRFWRFRKISIAIKYWID